MRVTNTWSVLALVALIGCGGVAVEEPEGLDETVRAPEQEEQLDSGAVTSQQARDDARGRPEQGRTRWVELATGAGPQLAQAVAHDRQGNAHVLIHFLDGIDLGERSFTAARGTVLAKYSSGGRLLWARLIEGLLLPGPLAVDDRGNIVLTLQQAQPYEFDGETLPPGIAVVKLDKKGRVVWVRPIPAQEGTFFIQGEVVVDRGGDVLLSGSLEGTADFGEGPVSSGVERRGAFVVKYDSRGRFEWLYLRDVQSDGGAIALDERGNVFLIGLTVRPEIGQIFGTPFVLKLSRQGEPRWTGHIPVGGFTDVAVEDNRVVASGVFNGSFSFAGETFSSGTVPGEGDADGMVLAWSLKGEEKWGRNFGATADTLSADERGDVVVAGIYAPGDDLGTGPLPGDPTGPASDLFWNFYVMKLEADDGDLRWVRNFVSAGAAPLDIAATRHGESTVVGAFLRPVDLGTGLLTPDGYDGFVLRLGK